MRDHPSVVKAFMGLAADQFWELIQQMTEQFAPFRAQQQQRPDRQRAVGAGRTPDPPLVIRTAVVLTYLRLHVPQATVAALFVDVTQADVSRDLRRVLPLIQQGLPCPLVWEDVPADQPVAPHTQLTATDRADGRVLVDATEQRVAQPQDGEQQKAYCSGKKHQHILKTQLVTDGEHHIKAISVAVPGGAA